jgi:aryl-alcohol dehydrogenase-like predicted oxidoreductase
MKYTQLGHTSLTVSKLCYGTWQFGGDWGSFEVREAQGAIRHALELGITFSARWLRRGVEESLRNLGVDHIDLYSHPTTCSGVTSNERFCLIARRIGVLVYGPAM